MEISNLEWKIQTTPLPLDEEKRVIAKIKSLEEQLYSCRKLKSLRDEIRSMENSIREIKGKISTYIEEIAEKVSEKQKIRERLAELIKEINEIKCKIDKINKEYEDKKEKILELCSRRGEILSQIMAIKKGEERKKVEQELMLKERIKKEVLEKIKRGENVPLEEFKIFLKKAARTKFK
ncbi:MAG: hypothetical protein QXH24_06655 [Candidatus Bathyarchaeia archaeon]